MDDPIYLPSSKAELTGITVNFDDNGKLTDPEGGSAVTLTPKTGDVVSFSATEVLQVKKDNK
ncbi:hypothetical protein D3C71_1982140 [compost metagenome]